MAQIDVWKWHTYLALQHWELVDYVKGTAPKPTPIPASSTGKDPSTSAPIISNADQIRTWDQGNREALLQIILNCKYEVAAQVTNTDLALEAWSAIHSRFEGKGSTAVAALFSQLWGYRLLPERDMLIQIQEIKSITAKLRSLGYPTDDDYQAMLVINTLPPEWNMIWAIILHKPSKPSLQTTIDTIIQHETTLQQQQENALLTRNGLRHAKSAPSMKSKNPK